MKIAGLIVVALMGGVGIVPAPAVDPPVKEKAPSPKVKDGPVSPFAITGAEKPVQLPGWATLSTNAPPEQEISWEVEPDPIKQAVVGNSLFVVGEPITVYKVRATYINFDLRKAGTAKTKLMFLADPACDEKPDPKPDPKPKPDPNPDPTPVSKTSYFVVVEDTSKAGAWRGDILGSPKVAAWYKNLQGSSSDPVHRLISVHAVDPNGNQSAEVKKFVELSKDKELPWLFLLDSHYKVIKDLKAPITPDTFIAAVGDLAPHKRAMGNIPPPEGKLKLEWKVFGDAPNVPLIPRDSWKPVDLSAFLPAVKDQDGIGACNAFATIAATEAARKQAGLKYARLSCGYLYGNINGGSDNGSMLEDGLAWMQDNGTCLSSTVGDLEWQKGRRNTPAMASEATSYKVIEAYKCPNFDAMASALQQGFFIVEGLLWYDNFNPDREGWLPGRGAGNYGGHALCGYGLTQRNGTWGIKTRNSWGATWGVGGNCIIPETLFGQQIGGFWAIRSVTQTPTDFSVSKHPTPRDPFRNLITRHEFALAP